MHSIDEEGSLLRVNRHWTETLGYEKDEVLGRKSIEFLTDESRLRATKDTLPLFWLAGTAHSIGYQFLTKDGGLLDVLLDADVGRTASDERFTLADLQNPFDTRQWCRASATIRALKELSRVQRHYEVALLSAAVTVYPETGTPAGDGKPRRQRSVADFPLTSNITV